MSSSEPSDEVKEEWTRMMQGLGASYHEDGAKCFEMAESKELWDEVSAVLNSGVKNAGTIPPWKYVLFTDASFYRKQLEGQLNEHNRLFQSYQSRWNPIAEMAVKEDDSPAISGSAQISSYQKETGLDSSTVSGTWTRCSSTQLDAIRLAVEFY
jgi:hypothetical protein